MKVEVLIPKPKNRENFRLSSFKSVPKMAGCYVLTTFEDEILYIGLSENLNERFQQHLENPLKTKPTNEGRAIWFYYLLFDPKNLPYLERTWINQFISHHGCFPIMNKVDSPLQ